MFEYAKLERSFVKDPSNSLKSRAEALHPSHFAALLQNYKKVFEGLRETFFKKFPYKTKKEATRLPFFIA